MFTESHLELFDKSYFNIVKQTSEFIEVRSKCTGHYWRIEENLENQNPYRIFHKHSAPDRYHYQEKNCASIYGVIEYISMHDNIVLTKKRKREFENNPYGAVVYNEDFLEEE